jgi:proteasome assembly chaperone (PAC2) family protein
VPDLYRLHESPDLTDPVLVVGLDGWIDAGYAATNAVGTMLEGAGYVTVATFDADLLLDHRSRRPTMHIDDGVNTGLTWPTIELRAAVDIEGAEALFLVGAEPDHLWRAFSAAVIDLAHEFGTTEVVSLGAYPAAVPHTRPVRVIGTAVDAERAHRVGTVAGRIDVPAGVHAAIEAAADESGLPSLSLWAQVPHYSAAMPYQEASLALIEALGTHALLNFPKGTLADDARNARARLDELVGNNAEHQAMVAQLEHQYETSEGIRGPLPTGDDLAAELEQFLRDQD